MYYILTMDCVHLVIAYLVIFYLKGQHSMLSLQVLFHLESFLFHINKQVLHFFQVQVQH